jgi:hypothetical protein
MRSGMCLLMALCNPRGSLLASSVMRIAPRARCKKSYGPKMSDISDSKRDAAECRRAAAAGSNPNVAGPLLLIADA